MTVGRLFFAIAMIAFGVQHVVYGDFVTRIVPPLPEWIPGRRAWAYLVGLVLVAAGGCIILRIRARSAALVLGVIALLSFVLLYVPALVTKPRNGGLWTNAFKALALAGGAFTVARTLPRDAKPLAGGRGALFGGLEILLPYSRFFFASFLVLGGVQHFIYTEFVATLVPAWIPGHVFFAYVAGVALIAGGLGIMVPMTTRRAAALSGSMIFVWVIVLHIPRAAADLHNSNETTAVFEALAFSGVAFLLAAVPRAATQDAPTRA
jgi:uncharacterized membrane protein